MSVEEVAFAGGLALCCAAGAPCRALHAGARRHCGAALGLLVVWLVCGARALHALLLAAGNVLIMRCVDRRHIHEFCLVYSWMYLLYLHTSVASRYAIGIYQTLALRLVGLASEIHSSDQLKEQTAGGILQASSKFNPDEEMTVEPGVLDIFQYTFSYIGIQKGPYYKWKTFDDYFTLPYSTLGDCRAITEKKLQKAAICSALYIWLRFKFPLSEYEETDFYWKKGPDYRFLYGAPQLVRHVLACQLSALLATAACSEAGFAVYPVPAAATTSAAATTTAVTATTTDAENRFSRERLSFTPTQNYSFSVIKCFDYGTLVTGPSMRKTLRGWDMCLQHWFWAHVYRKIDHPSRHIRNAVSFAVWCIWCGPSVNQLILGTTLWIYIYLEDVYSAMCSNYTAPTDSERMVWTIGFSLARILCLVYVAPCFVLERGLVGYYNSVYWALHAALAAAALVAGAARVSSRRYTRAEPARPQPQGQSLSPQAYLRQAPQPRQHPEQVARPPSPPPARQDLPSAMRQLPATLRLSAEVAPPSIVTPVTPVPPRPLPEEPPPVIEPDLPPVVRVLPENFADAPPPSPLPQHRPPQHQN